MVSLLPPVSLFSTRFQQCTKEESNDRKMLYSCSFSWKTSYAAPGEETTRIFVMIAVCCMSSFRKADEGSSSGSTVSQVKHAMWK